MNRVYAAAGTKRWAWLLRVALAAALTVELAALAAPAEANAQTVATEAGVKAAYLFRFLSYIEWPAGLLPEAASPLVIGVAGAEDVFEELQALVADRQIDDGRPVLARRVAAGDSLDGLHAIFIGRGAPQSRLLERLRGRPVLVVTDSTVEAERGMLHFVPVQGRIRFEASPAAAERAGLKLGARLLAVAERVVTP